MDSYNSFYPLVDENIDVLVNNAGIAIDTTWEDKTKENFRK